MSYSKQNFRSGDTLYASQLNAMDDEIAVLEAEVESTKNMVGSPLTASTAAGMTDQTKIYVYTGSETGYTAGHWYYYNGTAWTDGGVYNSVAVNTDTSLRVSGQAADSKAVGDAIDEIDGDLTDVKSDLSQSLDYNGYFINDGKYTIKASDLESGQWSYSTKAANAARARTRFLLPVRIGMVIQYTNTTFDTYFGVLETPASNTYIQTIGWKTDGSGTVRIIANGYLTFIIRNHADTTATVNPSDYDSNVVIETSAINAYPLTNEDNLDNIVESGYYAFMSGSAPVNWPVTHAGSTSFGTLLVIKGSTFISQFVVNYSNVVFVRRRRSNGTWNDWTELAQYSDLAGKISEPSSDGTNGQVLTTDGNGGRSWTSATTETDSELSSSSANPVQNSVITSRITTQVFPANDADNVVVKGTYIYSSGTAPANLPIAHDKSAVQYGMLNVYSTEAHTGIYQTYQDYGNHFFLRRRTAGGSWSEWIELVKDETAVIYSNTDLDDLKENGIYAYVSSTAPVHWPCGLYGTLTVIGTTTFVTQVVVDYSNKMYARRMRSNGTWSGWTMVDQERTEIKMTSGYYINLAGTTADTSNPTASSTGYEYSVVNCVQGDIFIITAKGGTSPRAYGFIDSNNQIIERANAEETLTDQIVVAPYGAAKIIINDKGTSTSYKINETTVKGTVEDNRVRSLYKAFQRVGVIGDSLSVGYMWNKATSTAVSRMLQYSWVKQISRECGVPWLNLGTSGQNTLTWCTNETYGKVQLEASGNKCQAYIIGLGENDAATNTSRFVPLGTSADIVDNPDTVATTFYGGYNRIIQLIKRLNPDAKIFCLTNANKNATVSGNYREREEYSKAVRYIATTHYTTADNVYLIDLEADYDKFFFVNSPIAKDGYFITSHFSAVGYEMIAEHMKKVINQVMLDYQTDFINIAYIAHDTGTPTANTMTE